MNIYLLERIDNVNFDETESMVVVAQDEVQARQTASIGYWGDYKYNDDDIKVTKIELTGESRIISYSFRAG